MSEVHNSEFFSEDAVREISNEVAREIIDEKMVTKVRDMDEINGLLQTIIELELSINEARETLTKHSERRRMLEESVNIINEALKEKITQQKLMLLNTYFINESKSKWWQKFTKLFLNYSGISANQAIFNDVFIKQLCKISKK